MEKLSKRAISLGGGGSVVNGSLNNTRALAADDLYQSYQGIYYCVGQASDPPRVRIFKNRTDCNIDEFTTLVTVCEPKTVINSVSLPKINGCVGIAENPMRSIYYSDYSNCNRDGWKHDFTLSSQTTKGLVNMNFLLIWEAQKPQRMTFSPGGADLSSSGWTYRDFLGAYLITYPMTPSGLVAVKPNLKKAIAIYKRLSPLIDILGRYPITMTMVALTKQSLEGLTYGIIKPGQAKTVQQIGDIDWVRKLAQELMGRKVPLELTKTEVIPGGFEGNLVTIQLWIDGFLTGYPIAILSMDENINYGTTWVREALIRSMMNREPIVMYRAWDKEQNNYRGFLRTSDSDVDIGITQT